MIRDRDALGGSPARDLALDCVEAGVRAADPERAVREALDVEGDRLSIGDATYDLAAYDDVIVVGAGKATVGLARGLEARLGDRLSGGIVVSDAPADLDRIEVLVGDHPVPSERGVAAAERVRTFVELADERTLLFAAFTGGGSALFTHPAADLSLADLRATTDALLRSGASIDAVNAVRKHLSAVKGGRLAAAADGATVVGLLVSDVVGDDPSVIASGPVAPDPTTYRDALDAVASLSVPDAVHEHLERGAAGEYPETPAPGDAAFDRVRTHVLASGETALAAASEVAEREGYHATVLDPAVTGEARESAADHLDAARRVLAGEAPVTPPAVLLTGGELTVTVDGDGEGGPNQEFCLAAALDCPGGVTVAAVDTDGRDGSTDAAGAIVDADTVTDRAAAEAALAANDAFSFLDARDALVRTGRTGTNVNDLRVVVVW
ncbi:MAG: glycerate kinase [Haloarculaceae archaeon]